MVELVGFEPSLQFAESLDASDPLGGFRKRFAIPDPVHADTATYLVGHSLGLQPRSARDAVIEELDKWASLGVRGHFETDRPWADYHEFVAAPMAQLVGAQPTEVVAMNGLTVNLHLLMASFYRPTTDRHKILIEAHAFPSDHFAAESQIRWHGLDPADSLVQLVPRDGEETLRDDDVVDAIRREGSSLALVLLPGVQYYTGQVLPMAEIVRAARHVGAAVGLDLAHAAGNVEVQLHDWAPDFAAWCTYKYLNSGPGSTAVAFVHERHHETVDLPRLHGWWGHDKRTRFEMENRFVPIPTAEAWQLSNAPVLSMAPLIASLAVFTDAGGMGPLRQKAHRLSGYMDQLLETQLVGRVERITPTEAERRGCQQSLRIVGDAAGKTVHDRLLAADVECDWRNPDVIRVAPVPLYNSFADVHRFVTVLSEIVQ